MVSRAELLDSLIDMLDHFKSCQQCDIQVLAGILDQNLLKKFKILENKNSKTEKPCNGSDLANAITKFAALENCPPTEVKNNGISKDDEMVTRCTKEIDLDESVSIISVSTTSDIVECASSGVSSDPFSLLNIVSNLPKMKYDDTDRDKTDSTEFTEAESAQESTFELESSGKSEMGSASCMSEREEASLSCSVLSNAGYSSGCSADSKSSQSESMTTSSQPPLLIGRTALRDAFLQKNRSLELKNPQNNISLEPKTIPNNSSLKSKTLLNVSSLEPRKVPNNSSLKSKNMSSLEPRTLSTSPGPTKGTKEIYYRCTPTSSSIPNSTPQKSFVYTLVTTSDINSGKLWKKRVELHGTITRCFAVQLDKSQWKLKLLNFTDANGVTQITLRGPISGEYDKMNSADLISVKGVCEKRCSGKTKSEKKQNQTGYEVIVETWSTLSDKENEPGNIRSSYRRADRLNNSTPPRAKHRPRTNEYRPRSSECNSTHRPRTNEYRPRSSECNSTQHYRDEPIFGSTDIRYMDSEPRSNRGTVGEGCRNIVNGVSGAAGLKTSRNRVRSPLPQLLPVENRGTTGVSYSPTVFISEVTRYMNSDVVTWGSISDVTPSSATLSKNGIKVLLKFNAPYQVDSSLVIVEGTPSKNKKNQTILSVERIEDLNQKHVPCLMFLASPAREGCKSVKKINDLPKIINGSDLKEYLGKFVIVRAKLVDLPHGGKKGLSKGCVVCGDGMSVNFSCLPFVTRNSDVQLGDQVVLIGKVDVDNKRCPQSTIPWITIDHLQVIPDKEADSILGFTKSAIYEALKQIVLDTLKKDERALECDPWNFLKE